MKRLLDCNYSDVLKMTKQERLESIRCSEGRIMIQELSLFHQMQLLEPISDAEIACAFGADLLLFNAFDVYHPAIPGIEGSGKELIQTLKEYTGRMIGINLEPIDARDLTIDKEEIENGRVASYATVEKVKELGFDFILLTGNPGTGVSNDRILEVLHEIKDLVQDDIIVMAGKMHAAGSSTESGSQIILKEQIEAFAEAGADVILLPAPGTVPGICVEAVHKMVSQIHALGKLALTAIGTSQEGSDEQTIRNIALYCKMAGADLHHIGDASLGGMNPENLMTYSIAIKGRRHTYLRMARSINR